MAVLLASLPLAAASLPPPPPASVIEARVIAAFVRDQKALRQFQFLEHVVTDKDGAVDARTLRVWYVNGNAVSQTVALDNRELSQTELSAEAKRAQIRARAAANQPPPPDGVIDFDGVRYPFSRLAHDYLFTDGVTRTWHGRTIWVYQARPDPGVTSRSRAETMLLHSSGEVWVDAEDLHVIRLTIHSTSPVRYLLGVLATIHQAQLSVKLQRYGPGVWLPATSDFSMRATVLMLDKMTRSKQQNFRDFTVLSATR